MTLFNQAYRVLTTFTQEELKELGELRDKLVHERKRKGIVPNPESFAGFIYDHIGHNLFEHIKTNAEASLKELGNYKPTKTQMEKCVNHTITITTRFNEEELAKLNVLRKKIIDEKMEAGLDDIDTSFETFLHEHIHLYLFEHLEENVKLMLLEAFGLDEAEIGYYEREGRFH